MKPAVHCRDLHFAYPPVLEGGAPVPVLAGVSLQVEPGAFVGIIGPNGAGKTTLLLILAGLAPRLTGGDCTGAVEAEGRVGVVFQEPEGQLFNPTVETEIAWGLENLALPRTEMHDRIDWALTLCGLEALRSRAPGTLSGGEKKRLLLAATLAMQPDILLLDEPAGGLDPQGRAEVLGAIADLPDMTVIMAENDADAVANFSERVLVLHEGVIAREGTPGDVFIDTDWLDRIGAPVTPAARLARALGRADFVTEAGAANLVKKGTT